MITITPGWWLLPAAVSIIVWVWVVRPRPYVRSYDIRGLFDFTVALIATLVAWLIYFATLAFT